MGKKLTNSGPLRESTCKHSIYPRALLPTSPRLHGKPTSLWTSPLVAEVLCEQGLTQERLSREAIRQAIVRLGVKWQRAKDWITSPDPQYLRKKSSWTE